MMQNWTKIIIINGYVFVEKKIIIWKIIYAI